MKNGKNFLLTALADKVVISAIALTLILAICMLAGAYILPTHDNSAPPSGDDFTIPADDAGMVVQANIDSMTLTVTRPDSADLVPYTERGFDEPLEASVAWWMNQGFMANTSEYRWFLRTTPDVRDSYYEPAQVFFDFVTDSLDDAENASALHDDMVLYRGMSGNYVYTMINNSAYSDNAYSSTSYDPTVCLNVTFGARTSDGYQNVLVMKKEKGEHALYINEEAREVLIPRESRFTVTKIVNVGNLTVRADFPLIWSTNMTATFEKVRLIYLAENN
ncbi:MAG: ADP-ribosyltransferase [Methanocella sp.]